MFGSLSYKFSERDQDQENPYMIYIPLSWEICNDVPIATMWFSNILDNTNCFPYRGVAPKLPSSTKCMNVHYLPVDTDEKSLICILVMSDLKEWETKEKILQVSFRENSVYKIWLNSIEWISIHSILSYSWNKCKHTLFPKWCNTQNIKKKICESLCEGIDERYVENDYYGE